MAKDFIFVVVVVVFCLSFLCLYQNCLMAVGLSENTVTEIGQRFLTQEAPQDRHSDYVQLATVYTP